MLNLNPFHPRALSVAAALALAATGALAQTASSTATTTIGVTPQEAQEALQKAKPQADTGTLVRTEPSAAERARKLAEDAKTKARPTPAHKAAVPAHGATSTHQPVPSAHAPTDTAPHLADAPDHKTTGTVTNTTTPNAGMGITGTLPGATPSNMDATNTQDNADKRQGSAAPMDSMGNRRSSTPPEK